jgi:hypothetical protein
MVVALLTLYFFFRSVGLLFPERDAIYFARQVHDRVTTFTPSAFVRYFELGRFTVWKVAGLAMLNEPLSGIGPANLYYQYPWWRTKLGLPPQPGYDPPAAHAHNYFLQVGAELGLVGCALCLAFFVSLFAAAWRTQKLEDPGTRWLGRCLTASLLIFIVTSLTGHPLLVPEVALLFWLIAGTILALAPKPSNRPVPIPRRAKYLMGVLGLLLTVGALATGMSRQMDNWSEGFFGVDSAEGYPLRWTRRAAVEQVPAQGTRLSLSIRATNPDIFRVPLKVYVKVNGQEKEALLTAPEWHELQFAVLKPKADISIVSSRTWNPKIEFGSGDWRDLGVQVRDYRWQK